jgi:hypothetical protein
MRTTKMYAWRREMKNSRMNSKDKDTKRRGTIIVERVVK